MKKQYNYILLFLLVPFLVQAATNDFIHSKQKNIKKAYYVNPNAILAVDNSYGSLVVTTWDEDKIELDVQIRVSGDNENWVNQKIDAITIDIQALKGLVTAKTIFENSNIKSSGKKNSFEINYILKIPRNGSIKLNNKYGNITTTDIVSNAEIKCKYGKITTGKLQGISDINIEYCNNSSIEIIKNGQINARYSSIKIDETNKLQLTSDYTDIEILNGDSVACTSDYGKIKISKIRNLEASGDYLTIQIGEITGSLSLQTKYSSLAIQSVHAKAKSQMISAAYTGITIGFQTNYYFDLNAILKYANLKYDSALEMDSKEENSQTKKYTGFHKRKGINSMTITSNYGNVVLTQNQ
jgi:hypothetical protein